jgi:hypothetical protein
MDLDLIIHQVVSLSSNPSQLHEELSIYEVGFSPTCIQGLEWAGVQLLRDIFDAAERFHGGTVGSMRSETMIAYVEAVKHLHKLGWWPWPEDLEWFDNND